MGAEATAESGGGACEEVVGVTPFLNYTNP